VPRRFVSTASVIPKLLKYLIMTRSQATHHTPDAAATWVVWLQREDPSARSAAALCNLQGSNTYSCYGLFSVEVSRIRLSDATLEFMDSDGYSVLGLNIDLNRSSARCINF
jgi:hypothetical protein